MIDLSGRVVIVTGGSSRLAAPRARQAPTTVRDRSSTLRRAHSRRPDLAKYVHAHCRRQVGTRLANRRACVPARFLVVCEDGHLDVPYVEYVHMTRTEGLCDGPQLSMSDAASTRG